MLILAAVTVAYTTIGGIEADIYSDIIQMLVLALGTIIALAVAVLEVLRSGGLHAAWERIDPDRLRILDFSNLGIASGDTFTFWPMLLGGFFLYVSYYGCDQSQAQRLLTSESERESSRGLLLNGLLRFPFTLLYCLFGLVLLVFLTTHPEFGSRVPADQPDYLVPMFILEYLPTGLVGFVMAAIFAAAMSSFDSAFNSMSAVMVRNILGRDEDATIGQSRLWTLFWGIFCALAGYGMSRSGVTVIELVNMIGSAFYGPTLAVFGLGLLSRRTGERGVLAGLAAGVTLNISLWLFAPALSWLWWNPAGFLVSLLVSLAAGRVRSRPGTASVSLGEMPVRWLTALLTAFAGILITCLLLDWLLSAVWTIP
jgi:SSS family solute:Na+ symporter